eukprot:124518_1
MKISLPELSLVVLFCWCHPAASDCPAHDQKHSTRINLTKFHLSALQSKGNFNPHMADKTTLKEMVDMLLEIVITPCTQSFNLKPQDTDVRTIVTFQNGEMSSENETCTDSTRDGISRRGFCVI